jgi:hypothetical protein
MSRKEDEYLIERMGKLLAEIAIIVNGPQPMGVLWSYADLPEKVQALNDAALNAQAGVVEALQNLADAAARAAGGEAVKPLTKCQPYLWRELDGTPSIVVIDTESGSYYRASEADARIAELEAERDAARAELDRKRVLRNSDQTRSRCKHFAICLAEIALNGSKEAEAAFRAVMPLVSTSHPSRREVKDAARIASGGVFGVSDDPYQDAARGAA